MLQTPIKSDTTIKDVENAAISYSESVISYAE